MSEILRYGFNYYPNGYIQSIREQPDGRYCLYTDLAFYRRMYGVAATMLVVVCVVFAAFLVTGKHAPQPVAKQASVENVQSWQAISEKLEQLTSSVRQAGAALDKLHRDADRERATHQKMQAIYESNLKEQNAKLDALNKPESVLARPMHDGELFKLAKGFGFTKVRVEP